MMPQDVRIEGMYLTRCISVFALSCALACGTTKPCSETGDVSWDPPFKGDQVCYQKKQADGTFKNHGKYVRKHEDGKVAVEGQFVDGQRHGIWIEYDKKGSKVKERFFEHGVDKTQFMKAMEEQREKKRLERLAKQRLKRSRRRRQGL